MIPTIRPIESLLDPLLTRPSALDSTPRDESQIWLDKNENLDPDMMRLSRQIIREIPDFAFASYPECGELYRKIAARDRVDPRSLLLTSGSDGAIRGAFQGFVRPGDTVVHPNPTFAMYPIYSMMFGARPVTVDYVATPEGPRLPLDDFIEAIRQNHPTLVCLPNPDSPSGSVVSQEDLRTILRECELVGAAFLVDEAYYPFHAETVVPWVSEHPGLIVARTFAKAWGAAGIRVGYAVAATDTAKILHKMRPMYEVGAIQVAFLERLLDHADAMERSVGRIREGGRHFRERISEMGFSGPTTHGNFVHVAFGDAAEHVHAALSDYVLYRKAFEHPAFNGLTRFSLGPKEIMERVAQRIESVCRPSAR